MSLVTVSAVALGLFLVTVGATHFLAPAYYHRLVPRWAPARRAVVAVSGAVEIAVGVAVLVPPSRALGAWAAAALISAYLVVHVDAARHASRDRPRLLDRPPGVAARLVVNVAYIAWAVAVALAAG